MSRLIVYVPGLGRSPDTIDGLYEQLRGVPEFEAAGETHLYKYRDPVSLFSRGELGSRCEKLVWRIDAAVDHYGVDDVILIGHSLGGLMLRYAYLEALTTRQKQPNTFAWVERVSRIVLLAAPNRGFDLKRVRWWAKPFAHALAAMPVNFTCKDALTGSAFVSDLRIRWIREMQELGAHGPDVIQLLGDDDQSVDYEDSRDVQGLANGAQRALPQATHADIVSITAPEDIPGQRFTILRRAILGPINPESSNPKPLTEVEQRTTDIVFALHGIRAGNADWPARLRAMLAQGSEDTGMRVITPSYGRMSALHFAIPASRRRHLRWFADQYTYYLARHPGKAVRFHFVGHSNGTYILGQSLARIRGLEFDRVFLAGSVLPQDFGWQFQAEGRIRTLFNVCATKDKPVAWLCSLLSGLGQRDVGVGGFQGFDMFADTGIQVRWIEGGHGAAFATKDPLMKPRGGESASQDAESRGGLGAVTAFVRGENMANRYDDTATPKEWFALVSRFARNLAVAGATGICALGGIVLWKCGIEAGAWTIGGVLAGVSLVLKSV